MPILNYTTKVPPERSVAEIITLLARKSAHSITQDFFEDGRHKAITFIMVAGGIPTRFQLPVNIDGVTAALLRDKPYNPSRHHGGRDKYTKKMRDLAEWVSWRILKDWVAAQLAIVEAGMAEAAQVFFPYATEQSGRTIYELFIENNQKQLGSGEGE